VEGSQLAQYVNDNGGRAVIEERSSARAAKRTVIGWIG